MSNTKSKQAMIERPSVVGSDQPRKMKEMRELEQQGMVRVQTTTNTFGYTYYQTFPVKKGI